MNRYEIAAASDEKLVFALRDAQWSLDELRGVVVDRNERLFGNGEDDYDDGPEFVSDNDPGEFEAREYKKFRNIKKDIKKELRRRGYLTSLPAGVIPICSTVGVRIWSKDGVCYQEMFNSEFDEGDEPSVHVWRPVTPEQQAYVDKMRSNNKAYSEKAARERAHLTAEDKAKILMAALTAAEETAWHLASTVDLVRDRCGITRATAETAVNALFNLAAIGKDNEIQEAIDALDRAVEKMEKTKSAFGSPLIEQARLEVEKAKERLKTLIWK